MTDQTPPTDRPLTAGDVFHFHESRMIADMAPVTAVWVDATGVLYDRPTGGRKWTEFSPDQTITFVSRPATSAASEGEGVERTIDGETVLGFKVAAWRYLGPKDDARFGYRLCEHWSTPGNHHQKVDRLFTEAQLRAALASPPAREEAPAEGAGELWPVGSWLSAALDDPKVCAAMKADIREWFDNGGHFRNRTSEPEAGEASQNDYSPRKTLTDSAPATADKLRLAVEALETAREDMIGWFEAIDAEVRVEHEMHVTLKDDLANIDQALAALNEGGE